MQPEKLEYFKSLIQTSSLLSDFERGSWLEMLPIMNDKQLTDLEAILSPAPKAPTPSAKPQADLAGIPLSHISNLPKGASFGNVLTQSSEIKFKSSANQPVAAEASDKKFATQLKDLLAEKELPAPKTPSSPSPAPLPPVESLKQNIPFTAPPPPPPKPNPVSPIPSVAPTFFNPKPKPTETTAQNQAWTKSSSVPILKREIHLGKLNDVSELTLNSFRAAEPTALIETFHKLIKKFGYYDVLFALEQSPLYQKYLEAGTAVLEQNISFDQFSNDKPDFLEVRMNKEDFEAMTDLLRQLQGGN